MATGLGTLKLTPQCFWSLSLPEWRALTTPCGMAAMARGDLDYLMTRYPD